DLLTRPLRPRPGQTRDVAGSVRGLRAPDDRVAVGGARSGEVAPDDLAAEGRADERGGDCEVEREAAHQLPQTIVSPSAALGAARSLQMMGPPEAERTSAPVAAR